jgi:hypothetical protein
MHAQAGTRCGNGGPSCQASSLWLRGISISPKFLTPIRYRLLNQIGPLRAWPGGLCLSRTIGDIDAGQYIVPVPHVKQIKVSQHEFTVSDVITLVYRYNMHREGNFLVFDSDHESENFWASAFTWRRQAHHCLRWSVGSADLREGCQGVSWGEASGDCCKEHRQGVLNKY